jgi:hypothetical protein
MRGRQTVRWRANSLSVSPAHSEAERARPKRPGDESLGDLTGGVRALNRRQGIELRQSITELKLVGRSLNQIARVLNRDARATAPGRQEVQAMLRVAEGLRDHFRALLKANVESWQRGHAEFTH